MNINFELVPNPCFLFDEKKIRENCEKIKFVANKTGIKFLIAFKAFAQWKIFPIIREYIDATASSSVYEALLSYNEFKTKTHLYCVAIDEKDIDIFCELSTHITFNSLNQFYKYKEKVLKKGISIGIRVNPEYSEVKTALYNPASPFSRLGMCAEHFSKGIPNGIDGLHFHVLCENDSFALEKTLEAFIEKFGHLLKQVKWLNLGGGHLITHKEYDIDHLISVINRFKLNYPHLELYMEPGAAYVWEAGYLVAKVLDIVENNNVKTAILNVSFANHMPDTIEMPYKPKILGASLASDEKKYVYRIGGNSCLAGDFMTEYSFDYPLKIGDIIVFEDMAHYTIVKTHMFNGVNHPCIGLWSVDNEFKLLKKFSYDDYKNRMN
ncbi:MAG: carboxynorspermidine decarboxylase [Bacteroidales bacterium]|nr:carboxynorspermidine decarboxylase [Bacteroidales bacterium]